MTELLSTLDGVRLAVLEGIVRRGDSVQIMLEGVMVEVDEETARTMVDALSTVLAPLWRG